MVWVWVLPGREGMMRVMVFFFGGGGGLRVGFLEFGVIGGIVCGVSRELHLLGIFYGEDNFEEIGIVQIFGRLGSSSN